MLSRNILRNLVSRALASTGRRSARRLIRRNSATERLESRKLLTTFTVTNSNDSNSASGTLRAAISQANFNPGPDTIDFDTAVNGVEIDLAFGQMDITGSLEIIGNGAENTIIDARQFSRIFNIMDSSPPFAGSPPFGGSSVSSVIPTDVTISNVTLKNGKVAFNSAAGGALRDHSPRGRLPWLCDPCAAGLG